MSSERGLTTLSLRSTGGILVSPRIARATTPSADGSSTHAIKKVPVPRPAIWCSISAWRAGNSIESAFSVPGAVSGLSSVDPSTSPRLSAMSPSAACAHPVDEPAIGIDETSARPINTIAASSGLCQARSIGAIKARNASGTARFDASPASTMPGRRARSAIRPALTRRPALNSSSHNKSLGDVIAKRPDIPKSARIFDSLIHSPGSGYTAARP